MKLEGKTTTKKMLCKGFPFFSVYGFYHFVYPSWYFSSLSKSILCRSSHTAWCVSACLRSGRIQLSWAAKWQERQQPPAAMGTTISRDLRLKFQRNNPNRCRQVREGPPVALALSFKAKCYCRRAWTWLHHPLKSHNNDSHIPARGNKAKQEFCLHKMQTSKQMAQLC